MPRITCRYCPFFVPAPFTPVYGDCAGVFPPKRVFALTDQCPYRGNSKEIEKLALLRGFSGHDLRRMEFYGVSEDGYRTRLYPSLDGLLNHINASGRHHTIYVCYIDSDRRVFQRAVLPEPGGII